MEDQKGRGAGGQVAEESLRSAGEIEVALRELNTTDSEQARQWRNYPEIWRWCRQNDFISDLQQRDWFQRQHQDPTIRMYGVTAANNEGKHVLVGVCGLTDIDFANSRAEFSLYIAPPLQRKGIGRAALTALLTHGFDNLGLNQIWGEVFAENRAGNLFESLGFKVDGKRRQYYFKDGKRIDTTLISMLSSEFVLWSATKL